MNSSEEQARVNKPISDMISNKDIPDDAKTALIAQVSDISAPLASDPWIYRIVVLSLGLAVLSTVIGGFLIKVTVAQDIPEGLIALGSAAVGALAGLLAPAPKQ